MTLGNLIRAIRADQGLSLSQLAVAIGVTKTHVWDLEQGHSANPTLNTLRGLARAGNLSLTALIVLLEDATGPDVQVDGERKEMKR